MRYVSTMPEQWGHSFEDYKAFKVEEQELIYNKCSTFKEDSLNVKSNSLPDHSVPSVNAIEECSNHRVIKTIKRVKTPLLVDHTKLVEYCLIKGI